MSPNPRRPRWRSVVASRSADLERGGVANQPNSLASLEVAEASKGLRLGLMHTAAPHSVPLRFRVRFHWHDFHLQPIRVPDHRER